MEPISKLPSLFQTSCEITAQNYPNELLKRVHSALKLCFDSPTDERPTQLLEREIMQLPVEMQADLTVWIFFTAIHSQTGNAWTALDQMFLESDLICDHATLRKIGDRLLRHGMNPEAVARKLLTLVPQTDFPFSLYTFVFAHIDNPVVGQLFNALLNHPSHTDNYCFIKALRKDLTARRSKGWDIPAALKELRRYLSVSAFTTLLEKISLTEEECFRLAGVAPFPLQASVADLQRYFRDLKNETPEKSFAHAPFLLPLAELLLMHIAPADPVFVLREWTHLGPVTKDRLFIKILKSCGEQCLESLFKSEYSYSKKLFRFCIQLGPRCSNLPIWPELFKNHVIPLAIALRDGLLSKLEAETFSQWLRAFSPNHQLVCLKALTTFICFPLFWTTLRLSKESGTPNDITQFLMHVAQYWPELRLQDSQKGAALRSHLLPPHGLKQNCLYFHHFPKELECPLLSLESITAGLINGIPAYGEVLLSLTLSMPRNIQQIRNNLEAFVSWVFNPTLMEQYSEYERTDSCLKLLYILTCIVKEEPEAEEDILPLSEIIQAMLEIGFWGIANTDIYLNYAFISRLGNFLKKVPRLQEDIYLDVETLTDNVPQASDESENEFYQATQTLYATEMNFEAADGLFEINGEETFINNFPAFFNKFHKSKESPEDLADLDYLFEIIFTAKNEFTHTLKSLPDEVILASARRRMQQGAPYNEHYASFILKNRRTHLDKDLVLWLVIPFLGQYPIALGQYLFKLEETTKQAKHICETSNVRQIVLLLSESHLKPWALEMLIERAFEFHKQLVMDQFLIDTLFKSVFPFLAKKPEEYFSLRKLEILFQWSASIPTQSRLNLCIHFKRSPLFPLIWKTFPLVDFENIFPASLMTFLIFTAQVWPTFRAPAKMEKPYWGGTMGGISPPNMYALKQSLFPLKRIKINEPLPILLLQEFFSGHHLMLRELKNDPSIVKLVGGQMQRFSNQFPVLADPAANFSPEYRLNVATDMFELLGQAIYEGYIYKKEFIKQFQIAVAEWLKVFCPQDPDQAIPATRALNVIPFIIAMGRIAKKEPELLRSTPPLDFSPVINYLGYWENFYENTGQGFESERNFVRDYLDLMKVPADQNAAVKDALNALRTLIPLSTESKLQ